MYKGIELFKEPLRPRYDIYPSADVQVNFVLEPSPRSTPADVPQYFNYSEPGETGNKTDVRWTAIEGNKGVPLLIASTSTLLSVNALPYTTNDLESAKHGWQLPRRNFTTLNIDQRQMGLGGENSWGATPPPPHVLPFARYEYGFRMRPFQTKTIDAARLAREALPAVGP